MWRNSLSVRHISRFIPIILLVFCFYSCSRQIFQRRVELMCVTDSVCQIKFENLILSRANTDMQMIVRHDDTYKKCIDKASPVSRIRQDALLQLHLDMGQLKLFLAKWIEEEQRGAPCNSCSVNVPPILNEQHRQNLDDYKYEIIKAQQSVKKDFFRLYLLRFGKRKNNHWPDKKTLMKV